MQEITHDLREFAVQPEAFDRFELLLTVKSFDLQAIRRRYLASRKRSRSGSVERREPSMGGVIYLVIEDGAIQHQEILGRIVEARGIDFRRNRLAFSSENSIFIFEPESRTPSIVEHTWFSYIHTVRWNQDNSRLLLASSGVDTIMQLETPSLDLSWEWLAWDHGMNTGENPKTGEKHILTRSEEQARVLANQGQNVVLVENPNENPLPTAMRAAFINSAEYDENGQVIATLFHTGEILRVDKESNEYSQLITGLSKPHGGMRYQHNYMVTDTAGGRVIVQHATDIQQIYDFRNLPGKPEEIADLEWLQTSHHIQEGIVTIDSNRTGLMFFRPQERVRMFVPLNPDWAIQDLVPVPNDETDLMHQVKQWFSGSHQG